MKKLALILVSLFSMCALTLRADNEKPIQESQLPAAAQQFLKQNFADRKVAFAKVETGLMSKSYEVLFSDGDQIEFDGNGNWEEIDCKFTSVPDAVIPARILEYVRANYPDATVKKIEKDRREYEVKLSNRIELTFDSRFNLTDIDL